MRWRNATHAFVGNLRTIMTAGDEVHVRGRDTLEIRNCLTELTHPHERCVIAPGRRGSIFAAIAETVWVLAGRNDLDFLTVYVPSAANYSDDGRTWRAGYGPRIRNWRGVDQLMRVTDVLLHDRASRRAVMSLFDPAEDFVESKDIPCNNWVHVYVRDEALSMNVAIRSNDIWFGFSGINAFEWSVVQEILAFWTGVRVGSLSFFASSLHLYRGAHGDRPQRVVQRFPGLTGYEAGVGGSAFATPRERFDRTLNDFLALERELRANTAAVADVAQFEDPLLRSFLLALWIYHGQQRWTAAELGAAMQQLPDTDVTLAVYDYFAEREHPLSPDASVHPTIAAFWPAARGERRPVQPLALLAAIRALHREKSAVYGDSWKRRGEVLGVLANVARKVDRLEGLVRGASVGTVDETALDTAVDLFVYALKYMTFLADAHPEVAEAARLQAPRPWSDGVAGFEDLLNRPRNDAFDQPGPVAEAAQGVVETFKGLDVAGGVTTQPAPLERFRRAEILAHAALVLVAAIAEEAPVSAHALIARGTRR